MPGLSFSFVWLTENIYVTAPFVETLSIPRTAVTAHESTSILMPSSCAALGRLVWPNANKIPIKMRVNAHAAPLRISPANSSFWEKLTSSFAVFWPKT